jgi:hypothetical protein
MGLRFMRVITFAIFISTAIIIYYNLALIPFLPHSIPRLSLPRCLRYFRLKRTRYRFASQENPIRLNPQNIRSLWGCCLG